MAVCFLAKTKTQGDTNGRKGTTKDPPGAPAYHRLTEEKHIIIETLRKEGCSNRHIAEVVGCSPSTVGRELKHHVSKRGYRHKKAQHKADHRVTAKVASRRKMTPEMWAFIKAKMSEGSTPEQIEGRCRRGGIPMVSRETIYNEYYRRQKLVLAVKSDEGLPPLMMRRIDYMLNDRPLKCLNWRTPGEAFAGLNLRHMRDAA